MTRHLCAAVNEAEPFVAAGAEAVPRRARTARPATTPTATSRRVERKLRRICGPFSPGVGRWGVGGPRRPVNVSGTVTTVGWAKSRADSTIFRSRAEKVSGTCFNAFMAELAHSRVTIREVADEAGVSIATVSRVLNGRGDVAPETRELVSRIIQERGYIANRGARGLSNGRTGLVGLLVPLIYPAYFSAILSGATEALQEHDLRAVLSPTQHEHDREVTLLERLMHGLTDGALIVLPEESSEELERLLDAGYHFVVIDPLMPLDERIPSVSAAHTSGADQAMRHLLALGHRRIAQITGPRGWLATEDRRRGYQAVLASAGILPDPSLAMEAVPEIDPGRAAAEHLLDLTERPTAIFAFNDNIAIGAIQAARA